MCFEIHPENPNPKVRYAYKVLQRCSDGGLVSKFYNGSKWKVGKPKRANRGKSAIKNWKDEHLADHGIYVYLDLDEAKRYNHCSTDVYVKVRVKGFRHVSRDLRIATYDQATVIAECTPEELQYVR